MEPKWVPNVCPEASRNGLDVNLRFVLGFGGPLGRFWPPSGHLFGILGSVLPPSGRLFGSRWELLCSKSGGKALELSNQGPHRQRTRNLAKIVPRFRRERAENPSGTRREPAVRTRNIM